MPDPVTVRQTIASRLAAAPPSGPVEVAFYGGSFSALPVAVQASYLDAARPFLDRGTVTGIRISTRPDAVDHEILALLKRHGVSTVELGAQSLDDEVLQASGRGHTAAHIVAAVGLLRERQFEVGLQLMPGLPADTAGRFERTVARVISLRPDLVRLYPALVIRDTPLDELYRRGAYRPLSLAEAVDQCGRAMARFEGAGIAVARVGLQATEELERPGTIVAGPWHPAFRQLVDASRFLELMREHLATGSGSGPVTFAVHPADLSPAVGQNRGNILALRDRFGRDAEIIADPAMPRGAVRLAAVHQRTAQTKPVDIP